MQADCGVDTRAGRSIAKPSPLVSRPVMMLYGVPLLAKKNGAMLNFSGNGRLVPIRKRCRTSPSVEGPHSARRL